MDPRAHDGSSTEKGLADTKWHGALHPEAAPAQKQMRLDEALAELRLNQDKLEARKSTISKTYQALEEKLNNLGQGAQQAIQKLRKDFASHPELIAAMDEDPIAEQVGIEIIRECKEIDRLLDQEAQTIKHQFQQLNQNMHHQIVHYAEKHRKEMESLSPLKEHCIDILRRAAQECYFTLYNKAAWPTKCINDMLDQELEDIIFTVHNEGIEDLLPPKELTLQQKTTQFFSRVFVKQNTDEAQQPLISAEERKVFNETFQSFAIIEDDNALKFPEFRGSNFTHIDALFRGILSRANIGYASILKNKMSFACIPKSTLALFDQKNNFSEQVYKIEQQTGHHCLQLRTKAANMVEDAKKSAEASLMKLGAVITGKLQKLFMLQHQVTNQIKISQEMLLFTLGVLVDIWKKRQHPTSPLPIQEGLSNQAIVKMLRIILKNRKTPVVGLKALHDFADKRCFKKSFYRPLVRYCSIEEVSARHLSAYKHALLFKMHPQEVADTVHNMVETVANLTL